MIWKRWNIVVNSGCGIVHCGLPSPLTEERTCSFERRDDAQQQLSRTRTETRTRWKRKYGMWKELSERQVSAFPLKLAVLLAAGGKRFDGYAGGKKDRSSSIV